jgi:hypothetical protein
MADRLSGGASDGLDALMRRLKEFSLGRSHPFVGQFLDPEGRDDDQFGVYGMSAWLLITPEIADVKHVADRREACRDGLVAWTNASAIPAKADADGPDELARIIPKMAYALDALNSCGGGEATQRAVGTLRSRIEGAQRESDGSWNFLVDPKGGSCIATAIVVKSLARHSNLSKVLERARQYLSDHVERIANPYEQLFVLTVLCSSDTSVGKKATKTYRKSIKKTIRSVFQSIRRDPTQLANPLNVDFNDRGRTRYFRMPTDLLLLEALLLLSGPGLLYARAHAGKRLARRLVDNVCTGTEFSKDLSQHRASTGVYLHARAVLLGMAQEPPWWLPYWVLALCAPIAAAAAFGLSFSFNVAAVIGSGAIGFSFLQLGRKEWAFLFFGLMLRTLADAIRSIWDTYWV